MKGKDYFHEETGSDDFFIKSLYTDLNVRIQEFESKGPMLEKMKLADARTELIIIGMITFFLIFITL